MDGSDANSVEAFQARLNRSTRRQWDWYASHRRELYELLTAPGMPTAGRLGVLGAGNCNDIHLPTLAERFQQIHLADIDGAAVANAVERQGMAGSTAITVHGGVDLSGAADRLSTVAARGVRDIEVDACLAAINQPAPPFASGLDVVLSPCVLSQIIRSAAMAVGDVHARFPELLVALRRRHFRLIHDLLGPGGCALAAIDLVSTETLPQLRDASLIELPGLMQKALCDGNFFSGLAPSSMAAAAEQAGNFQSVRPTRPWRWHLGERRSYLVYGMLLRRGEASAHNLDGVGSAGVADFTGLGRR